MATVQYDPLVQPSLCKHEIPMTDESRETVASSRYAAARVLNGQDDRLLVVVGPCSIHSPEQALEYAKGLKEIMPRLDGLLIVMRAYL